VFLFNSIMSIANYIRDNYLSEKLKVQFVYLFSGLFIFINSFLVYKEFYYGFFFPVIILIVLFFLFEYRKVLLLIIFFTPLSVYFLNRELNVGISVPVDPLLFGMMILFFLKVMFDYKYDRRALKHPVSIFIIINLMWMLITVITSQMHLVSIKYFIARLWFVIPMFFIGLIFFRDYRNIKKFFWYYAIPLLIVIAYATFRHYNLGFGERTGNFVMRPFYNDHTAYGAVMAMFIPVFLGFSLIRNQSSWFRISSVAVALMLMMALWLSFSRAAWLSVAFAFGWFIIIIFRIKFRWLIFFAAILATVFYSFRFEIVDYLSKNEQDASGNFVEHVQSIANISSDASNLERINRWQSAIRMFHERPVFGFGPGTYQFLYAPFQRSKEKTIISTNFGDVGNAHSEYIGPLAESGLMGMLTFLAIAIAVIYTGMKVYKKSKIPEVRIISLSATVGLISYLAHGFLNNFLDTEKLSVPFWGFVAVIVALDLYHKKQPQEKL
jgi:putative inorganic carbon (hco3(-)) transporter